jgi:hypothetical protein
MRSPHILVLFFLRARCATEFQERHITQEERVITQAHNKTMSTLTLVMTPHKDDPLQPSLFPVELSKKFKKKPPVLAIANAIGDVIKEQGGPLSPASYPNTKHNTQTTHRHTDTQTHKRTNTQTHKRTNTQTHKRTTQRTTHNTQCTTHNTQHTTHNAQHTTLTQYSHNTHTTLTQHHKPHRNAAFMF